MLREVQEWREDEALVVLQDVGNQANDREPWVRCWRSASRRPGPPPQKAQAFAECFLARPVLTSEQLVHNHHRQATGRVRVVELSTSFHLHLADSEVVIPYHEHAHPRIVPGVRVRRTLDFVGEVVRAFGGQVGRDLSDLDVGKRPEAVLETIVEKDPVLEARILRAAQVQVHRQDVCWY